MKKRFPEKPFDPILRRTGHCLQVSLTGNKVMGYLNT